MDTKASWLLDKVSVICLYLVIFLTPLFFLPFTIDVLELNKNFLFYFLIFISLICFLARGVLLKYFEFKRTVLDLPILILWVAVFLSSLLSREKYLSFFGDLGYLNLSFVGFSLFLVFYFLVVQKISNVKKVVTALSFVMLSGSLVSLYFILRVSGLLKILTVAGWPNNLINNSNTLLGIYLTVIFLISLSILTIKNKKMWLNFFSGITMALSLACLVLIGFKVVWVVIAVALALSLVIFLTYVDNIYTICTTFGFSVLVAALLFIFLGVPQFLTARLPAEISLNNRTSWNIVKNTLTGDPKSFIFGTGFSTFVYNFSKYRSESMNGNFAWNVRFQQPYSSALNWLSDNGLVGTLAFLSVVLMGLGLVISTWLRHIIDLRKKKRLIENEEISFYDSPLIFWGIVTGWLTLLVVMFFANLGAAHWVLFWLLTGLMITAGAQLSKKEVPIVSISLKTSPQYTLVTSFGFILAFTALIVVGVYLGRYFTAEVVFARALKQPLDQKINSLQQAITYNNHRVPFYLTLADSFLSKAVSINQAGGQVEQITSTVAAAVNAAKVATDISPNNVATWEQLSSMYGNARVVAPEANNWTIGSLEKASQLEPTNPLFYVELGNAKLLERRYTEAKEHFNKAIALKPDLLVSYLRLSLLQEAQNNIDEAIVALERGLVYGRQDAGYVFQLGRYYFNRRKKGDDGVAELAFRRAIALNPNYSDALFALALLYEKTGNKSQALQLYKRVLELNPNNKDLKAKINSLVSVPTTEESEK